MTYRITGLDPALFQDLFALDDAALAARGAQRLIAEDGFPCRVTLEDAVPGERVILTSHPHMDVAASPYRASGPVFVREGAVAAAVIDDTVPPYLATRLLSLRAYDADGIMVDAEVVPGAEADPLIRAWLARAEIALLHAHFARRGCFGARIERS
ncbi:hypothetical protein sos41_00270 [Alphaproteobacteria bacterium SO-S41]|nr:hypothetical protein sos41_00270 [Alphaproteobacteria bacterium SO-S41]